MANGRRRWYVRVRRDHPEIENGREQKKYVAPYGDRKHFYFPPCTELFADANVPIVLVEAEKSALALTAWSERTGRIILPLAMGGCWGWRGQIGITTTATGERVPETGAIHDLTICRDGRKTYVLLDSNCSTNRVQQARVALVRQLRKQGADVHILNLPATSGVNGPDDYIGVMGDETMMHLFDGGDAVDRAAFILTKEGKISPVLANAILMLRTHPAWEGVLGFNEFSLHTECLKPPPFKRIAGKNWTDTDDLLTCDWLQHNGVLDNSAADAVQTVAHDRCFHPVRDYLKALKWDGEPRLDRWLSTYLGAADTEWTRAIGPRYLISAVARIFEPGCQADYTLLLEGPQGIRKSSALRVLASDDWFSDHISELGSKDSRIELHGKWILEIAELDRVRRGDLERVKAFLTARIDNFRLPYGRRSEAVPRSCVFAATVNDQTPLTDETGNRRFWPVRCGEILIDSLAADRDQLWAEAYQRYVSGDGWWLESEELNQLARTEQDERYQLGPWDQIILEWIDSPEQSYEADKGNHLPVTPFDSTRDSVTIDDILIHAIGKERGNWTPADANQVARCLIHAGWTKKRATEPPRKRFYHRPAASNDCPAACPPTK